MCTHTHTYMYAHTHKHAHVHIRTCEQCYAVIPMRMAVIENLGKHTSQLVVCVLILLFEYVSTIKQWLSFFAHETAEPLTPVSGMVIALDPRNVSRQKSVS